MTKVPASKTRRYQKCLLVVLIVFSTSGCALSAIAKNINCSDDQSSPSVDCVKKTSTSDIESRIKTELRSIKGYQRDESQTFLTLPEWYLVYSPAEYAHYLKENPPSGFPYFGSIKQFWGYYGDVNDITKDRYPFNGGYHTMVMVIGTSFTVENAVKGIYENTIGRITEWISSSALTEEDRFAARVAQSYVDLIRVEPWYEYSFTKELFGLWTDTSIFGVNMIRKVERKLALSVGYSITAIYATLIKLGTKLAYGDADNKMLVLAKGTTPEILVTEPKLKVKARYEDSYMLLSLPRYEEFRDVSLRLMNKGVRFIEIAGNDEILVTCIAPVDWKYSLATGKALFERPILTDLSKKRVALSAPVRSLHEILISLTAEDIFIEHIYDY